jgi:hypothetical protein
MKLFLMVAGILAVLSGLVWAAQGSGHFPYPASSFMINQARWITIGLGTTAVGAIAVIVSLKL